MASSIRTFFNKIKISEKKPNNYITRREPNPMPVLLLLKSKSSVLGGQGVCM